MNDSGPTMKYYAQPQLWLVVSPFTFGKKVHVLAIFSRPAVVRRCASQPPAGAPAVAACRSPPLLPGRQRGGSGQSDLGAGDVPSMELWGETSDYLIISGL